MAFGLQFLAVAALLGGSPDPRSPAPDPLAALLVGVPLSSLALIVIALVAAGRPRRARLRLGPWPVRAPVVGAMVVGMLALSQGLESLSVLLGLGPGPTLDWINRTLAAASPPGLLLAVVVIGGLAPLGEELFFRGFMLTRLREAWRPFPAIVVTALAFGLIHGEWVHAGLAFGIGLYLGFLAERSTSVVPAVVCHAANNTASVLLAATVGIPRGVAVNAVLLAVAVLLFAGSLLVLRRAGIRPEG